jgi:immune inhibitor A
MRAVSAAVFALVSAGPFGGSPDRPVTVGRVPHLVVLVNFSNTRPTYRRDEIADVFRKPGYAGHGAAGSVRDYFREASRGRLDLEIHVTDWIDLDHPAAYYSRPKRRFDNNIAPLLEEALTKLDRSGFDFKPFDSNGDGHIDLGVGVVHQGIGLEEDYSRKDTFLSHQGFCDVTVDGVAVRTYYTVGEVKEGHPPDIGVICHEMGHAMGLPELYDAGRVVARMGVGLGRWSTMSHGAGNAGPNSRVPTHYSAWEKVRLGWVEPVALDADRRGVRLPEVKREDGVVYKISRGYAEGEYLLIENRQRTGFDRNLPGEGMLVYHVDESRWNGKDRNASTNNADRDRYHVGLVQADGKRELNRSAMLKEGNLGDDGDPFPGGRNVRAVPAPASYTRGPSGVRIENVSDAGPVMTFDVVFETR